MLKSISCNRYYRNSSEKQGNIESIKILSGVLFHSIGVAIAITTCMEGAPVALAGKEVASQLANQQLTQRDGTKL